jgi:hypothetical protein
MEVGSKVEAIIMDYLRSQRRVASVQDLRDIPEFRAQDVDFCVIMEDGRRVLVEVKSDYYLGQSGNILFELNRVYHDSKSVQIGWSARTPAEWVIYYGPQIGEIWQVKTCNLQQAFHAYLIAEGNKARIISVPTDAKVTTINVLIPEHYIQNIHKVKIAEQPK